MAYPDNQVLKCIYSVSSSPHQQALTAIILRPRTIAYHTKALSFSLLQLWIMCRHWQIQKSNIHNLYKQRRPATGTGFWLSNFGNHGTSELWFALSPSHRHLHQQHFHHHWWPRLKWTTPLHYTMGKKHASFKWSTNLLPLHIWWSTLLHFENHIFFDTSMAGNWRIEPPLFHTNYVHRPFMQGINLHCIGVGALHLSPFTHCDSSN